MKVTTLIGIALYGVANIFAGTYDLFVTRQWPLYVDFALVISGLLFAVAYLSVLRSLRRSLALVILALAVASAIALYNERVLGLGDPSHHLFRAAYTLIVFGAAYFWDRGVRAA